MTYTCPICGAAFEGSELSQPEGVGGGSYCPHCQGQIRISFSYGKFVGPLSLFCAAGIMLLFHVRSVFWVVAGTGLLSIPISLMMNIWSANLKPATFKRWTPPHRTFFEWLYERDSTPELFDKKDKNR